MRITIDTWDDYYQILWNILQTCNQATKCLFKKSKYLIENFYVKPF